MSNRIRKALTAISVFLVGFSSAAVVSAYNDESYSIDFLSEKVNDSTDEILGETHIVSQSYNENSNITI